MSDTTTRLLIPQYVGRFKCIGGACEDSCCQGWQVPIDRETYAKYRACPDEELLVTMTAKVTKNRSNPTAANYAKIKMDADLVCPFLDTERLCSIQRKLGEEYLSLACTTYPRISNVVNEVLEQSMTMSCPEAARLALLNPAPMEFDEVEQSTLSRNAMMYSLDARTVPAANAGHYFWELRIFTITLLQNREYTLGERLILLGMFYRKLAELVELGKALDIPELIASYTVNIERGLYREHLAELPARNPVQMLLLKQVVDVSLISGAVGRRYLECLNEFSLGIGNVDGALTEDVIRQYSDACEKYYEPFMKEHEYILENFLVNFVFRNLFPFNGQENVFENYVKLVVQYALIRTYLIGIAGYHKEAFNTGHVITLVQSFSKTIEHNNAYLKKLHGLLLASDSATMAHMALLINSGSSGN
ncbi:MAG: flagellin lysine-N-methylase [bacterium]